MKTWRWTSGAKQGSLGLAVVALLGLAGCAHKELTAPCADYKAARFSPAAAHGSIPCDRPLPLAQPPWTAALDQPTGGPVGG